MQQDKLYKKDQFQQLVQPLTKFLATENLSSKLLLLATIIALIWANSPWAQTYFEILHIEIGFSFGGFELNNSLLHWINDGLMVIFFFVVGLEIKREFLVGELSNPKKAALPIIAALGGMVVPALIFTIFNFGGPGASGWGIPMATDIAFALGVIMVLGDRVPAPLKVFLLALAIIDDLGAIVVIALFYTADLSINSLIAAGAILAILVIFNKIGIKRSWPYLFLGVFLWLAVYQSGIHATIAGVLLAMTIPSSTKMGIGEFVNETNTAINGFPENEFTIMCVDEEQKDSIKRLELAAKHVQSPLQRLEDALHSLSGIVVIPIFALANAGVSFSLDSLAGSLTNPVFIGIVLGLILGKQIGVTLFSWLGVKLGLANLPTGVNWKHVYGLSCLAGIGFTMSLFITNLAFVDVALIETAKVAILGASLTSAIIGLVILISITKSK